MRLGEILRFEVGHQARQPVTWAYAGVMLGLPFLVLHMIDGSILRLNAPEMVAAIASLFGTLGMAVTAALFGDAATRDVQSRAYSLFYTTPLREADYLGGRVLGAFVVNAVLLLGVPLGLLGASLMPYAQAGKFGPVQIAAYVQTYLLLLLPNLVLGGAVLFAIAALTRQSFATYLGAIAFLAARMLGGAMVQRGSDGPVAALADPSGAVALASVTQHWTLAERNSSLIGYPALLVWNRVLWTGVAAAAVVLLIRRFRFAPPPVEGRSPRRRDWAPAVTSAAHPVPAVVVLPAGARAFGAATAAHQTLAVAARSLADVAGNRAVWAILAGAVLFVFSFGWNVGADVFGTATWPVTHLVAGTVLSGALPAPLTLVVALVAGEVVWREREVRMGDVVGVSPVPGGAWLLGRFLALVAIIVVLQAVLMVAGMLLQTTQGYHVFEPWLYLRFLFGVKLADYVLFAALALAVYVIADQKYLGHLIMLLCYVFTRFAAQFGVQHHLLVYGSDPGLVYSDMNGFAPFLAPFVWFKLYWAGWALLLLVVAVVFRVRGRDRGVAQRLALARQRLTRSALAAAGVAAALIVSSGGFVFYNTNVLNAYETPSEAAARREAVERRDRALARLPQARLVDAFLRAEIRPAQRAVDLDGSYHLVNRTARPIDSVYVFLNPVAQTRVLALDRPAEVARADPELAYRIFALARPLAPGDSLRLRFGLTVRPRGFPNDGVPTAVTGRGAFFDGTWLPRVGHIPGAAESEPAGQLRADGRGDLVNVETVVGTDAGQTAVAPGTLRAEWRDRGRRYFRYRTPAPIPFDIPVLSAEYVTREARWNGVALRVLHHPAHTFNVDRMLRSMQASLAYLTEQFGPYPFPELRVVEFPRYERFASWYPHIIAYSEGGSFIERVGPGDVDRPFFATARETARQWWGGQLIPARAPGAALLSETLSEYSALMVVERALGRDQARRFYDEAMSDYLRGRGIYTNREVSLLDVEDQEYVFRHKGTVAMYTLRERLGAGPVNAALRRLLDRFRGAAPPYPTSRDLYAELQAVTPDSLRPLLSDLFEHPTLWRLRAESARAEPTGTGAFRVTLEVTASKVRVDSVGAEFAAPMDDLVEVGVYDKGVGSVPGEPLYLGTHRIRTGRQLLVLTVLGMPARASVDPRHLLIDGEAGDNTVAIERAGAQLTNDRARAP